MKQSLTTAILIVVGIVIGALGVQRVQGQEKSEFPFAVGDTVLLKYQTARVVDCKVEEIRGQFVKCHDASRVFDNWYNMTDVTWLEKKQ